MKRFFVSIASVLTLLAISLGAGAAPGQGSSCTGTTVLSVGCTASSQSGCGYGTGADLNALLEGLASSGRTNGAAQSARGSTRADVADIQLFGASAEGLTGACGSGSSCVSAEGTDRTAAEAVAASAQPSAAVSAQNAQNASAGKTARASGASDASATAVPENTADSTCAQSGCTADGTQCATDSCAAADTSDSGAGTVSHTSGRSLLDLFISLLEKCGIKADIFCPKLTVPATAGEGQSETGGQASETPAPSPADTGGETASPSGGENETASPSDEADRLTFEEQVAVLVNEQRAANGLSALTFSTALSDVARAKSQDMHDKGYFDHTSPTYGTPFDMLKTFGISYRSAGENIAMGYTTPEAVVTGWMNSAGHRANILNASYTQIGVGYVADGNYWTQLFIG